MPDNIINKQIGRYKILKSIGEGGMATVYLAEDTNLERQVALKMIRAELIPPAQLPRLLERFKREVKALAKLSDDPAIITVHDYGEFEGTPYLVMAYMPGGTLKDRLGQPMDYRKAAEMLIPVTRALGEAHQEGIIHRDVKPSNLLVDKRGQLALADFGIAKALEMEGQTLTGTGLGVGTPEYMAPEQWRGQASPQTDVYALGVVLYEMVTGKKPFKAENPSDIYLKQMTEAPVPPRELVPGLPHAVENVLSQAMHREAGNRFADMDAFRDALQGLGARVPLHDDTPAAVQQPDLETTYDELATPADGVQPAMVQTLVRQSVPPQDVPETPVRDEKKDAKRGWLYSGLGLVGVVAVIGLVSLFNGTGKFSSTLEPVEEPAMVKATATEQAPTETATEVPTSTKIPTSTATPTIAPTPMGGGSGKIAYVSETNGNTDVYLFDLLSRESVQLTDSLGDESIPVWAQDGASLGYIYNDGTSFDQIVDDLEGSSTKLFTRSSDLSYIWDSEKGLFFIVDVVDQWEQTITMLPSRMSEYREIKSSMAEKGCYETKWYGYVSEFLCKTYGIVLVDSKGENAGTIYHSSRVIDTLSLSRISNDIIFASSITGRSKIFIIKTNETNWESLTDQVEGHSFNPSWSSDGQKIAFSRSLAANDHSREICIMNYPDGDFTCITDLESRNDNPTWSPDGNYIAFASDRDGDMEIYIMKSDGTDVRQITDNEVDDYSPAWAPK